MRRFSLLAFACCLSVIACSGDDRNDESTDNHDNDADADAADGGDPDVDANETDAGDTQTDDDPPVLLEPPARGFQIVSPEITLEPGQRTGTCYYFRSSNTELMAVKRFVSVMTPGDYHMELYRTTAERMPPGTVSTDDCTHVIGSTDFPQWLYSARDANAELRFPTDDGTGKGLATDVEPNTPMFLRLEYSDTAVGPLAVQVTFNAEALEAGIAYTKTASYVTYNGSMAIPNGSVAHVEASACESSGNARFWMVSMHAHKQATKTRLLNGATAMYEDTNWENPTRTMFMTPSEFFTFDGDMTYECTYANSTGRTVSDGDSPVTDEVCKVTGYYFMAAGNPAVARACYTPGEGRGFTLPSWNQ